MSYITRVIEPHLLEYLQHFPVIGLTGPRQSGKSTLLQQLLPHYTYVTFDDLQTRQFCLDDPYGFIAKYPDKIIFDEAQKAPPLFDLLKTRVDQDRKNYGKFVLTGSSQFTFLRHISESLAGRIGLLSLLPLQFSEIPENLHHMSIYKGGYPELVLRQYRFSKEWYSSYIDTYLHKDLRDVLNVGNLHDFQRFLRLLAINTSHPLNMSSYSRDLGVSVPTIKTWISALEASYIIFLLPPYYKNYGKRITKSPKVCFYDTGLVSYFTAIHTQEQFIKGPLCGALFENYVIAEIKKKLIHAQEGAELFYYRTQAGNEIDLIIDYHTHRDLIEVKHTSTSRIILFEPIQHILEPQDQGLLLYNGKEFAFTPQLKAIYYQDYLWESRRNDNEQQGCQRE